MTEERDHSCSLCGLRAPDVTASDLSLPPSPTEAPAAGQSSPFHPDCSFLEGERVGAHPGCGLGKAGACGPIFPFPDVCSWWALSNKRCGQVAPMGAQRMFMHLKGSSRGGLPGISSQPHPPSHPHWRRQDLAQGPLGKPVALPCLPGLVRLHSSKCGPPGLSEKQQD